MVHQIQFDEKKFREMIVYIAHKSQDDSRFGAIKLNKILFYADFNAYSELGIPISGATYQHLTEGPAPRELLPTRRAMVEAEDIALEPRVYFGKIQRRITPLRVADSEIISPDERRVIDEVIDAFWHLDAREVSDYSHHEYGWRLTEEGETIPYASAFFSADPLTQDQIERGQEIARRYERSA